MQTFTCPLIGSKAIRKPIYLFRNKLNNSITKDFFEDFTVFLLYLVQFKPISIETTLFKPWNLVIKLLLFRSIRRRCQHQHPNTYLISLGHVVDLYSHFNIYNIQRIFYNKIVTCMLRIFLNIKTILKENNTIITKYRKIINIYKHRLSMYIKFFKVH